MLIAGGPARGKIVAGMNVHSRSLTHLRVSYPLGADPDTNAVSGPEPHPAPRRLFISQEKPIFRAKDPRFTLIGRKVEHPAPALQNRRIR